MTHLSWSVSETEIWSPKSFLVQGKKVGKGKLKVTHDPSGAIAETEITVTGVDVKLEEKSWSMSDYGDVEDVGETAGVPWYVVWTCDRQRFVVDVAGPKPEDIQSVSVGNFGAATLTDGKWYLAVAEGGISVSQTVKATVTLKNGGSMESQAIEVSGHGGVTIAWKVSSSNPALIDGTKVYPEKPTHDSPTANNQIDMEVTVHPAIPAGRTGSLHYKILDPPNKSLFTNPVDNQGVFAKRIGTLEISGTDTTKESMVFTTAQPGDNYIGVVYPNSASKIEYDYSQNKPIKKEPTGEVESANDPFLPDLTQPIYAPHDIPATHQTTEITVWRHLNIEHDPSERVCRKRYITPRTRAWKIVYHYSVHRNR